MTQINAYISFNGNCREAMNFYKDCLGGELNLMQVKDTPAAAACPAGTEDQIMHSSLTKNEMVLFATDMVGQEAFRQGNNMALCVNCSNEEEINDFFKKLALGIFGSEDDCMQFDAIPHGYHYFLFVIGGDVLSKCESDGE